MKSIFLRFIALITLACLLCGCAAGPTENTSDDGIDPITLDGEIIEVPDNAASYEKLLIEADNYMTEGFRYELFGIETVADYYYALALSDVASLRYAVENVIYLKDEKIDMLELQAGTEYIDWDGIAGISFANFWPAYFEGLIFEMQGKSDDAEIWYGIARDNPLYYETDFYYLKNWSLDKLYELHGMCLEKEQSICEDFTPKTKLMTTSHTGAEYIPDYNLYVMDRFKDSPEDFIQAAINFLSVTPFYEDGYCMLYLAYLSEDDVENALYYLSEGHFANPDGPLVNYYMGAAFFSMKEYEKARPCLEIAAASEEAALAEKANELLSKIK